MLTSSQKCFTEVLQGVAACLGHGAEGGASDDDEGSEEDDDFDDYYDDEDVEVHEKQRWAGMT